jgi:hypothetical protein
MKLHEITDNDEFVSALTARGGRVEDRGAYIAVYDEAGARITERMNGSGLTANNRRDTIEAARSHYRQLAEPTGPFPLTPATIVEPRDASESGDCATTLLKLLARGPVYIGTAGTEFFVATDPESPFAPTGFGRSLTDALRNADRLTK